MLDSPALESIIIQLLTVEGEMLGYRLPDHMVLDFNDKGTREAIQQLLHAPLDGMEKDYGINVETLVHEARDDIEGPDTTQDTDDHPDAQENAEEQMTQQIAMCVLDDAADAHVNAANHLLASVIDDHPRSKLDDPLHDVAASHKLHKAFEYLATRYQMERSEENTSPLPTILSKLEHHGMVQPDRQRGVHPDDARLAR